MSADRKSWPLFCIPISTTSTSISLRAFVVSYSIDIDEAHVYSTPRIAVYLSPGVGRRLACPSTQRFVSIRLVPSCVVALWSRWPKNVLRPRQQTTVTGTILLVNLQHVLCVRASARVRGTRTPSCLLNSLK